MTREVGDPAWRARYPDLAGKVAVVAGSGDRVVEIVAALAASGTAVSLVAADRGTIDAALAAAEEFGVSAIGVVADPADAGTWTRVVPHSEQRLGPLDILVTFGSAEERVAALDAITPDMARRRRGAVIQIGEPPTDAHAAEGVRYRQIATSEDAAAADIAAIVLLFASDVLTAGNATILVEPPS